MWAFPMTLKICFDGSFAASTSRNRTSTRTPPGATTSQAASCVSFSLTASNTSFASPFPRMALMSDTTVFDDLSVTCVAPRDLHKETLCGEAVVMIGENPERRASWIAATVSVSTLAHVQEG